MYEAKVTSKGQITIPIEVRRYLHITGGDKMSFKVTEQGILLEKSSRPLTIQERFENYNTNKATLEEAMQEIDSGENIGEEKR